MLALRGLIDDLLALRPAESERIEAIRGLLSDRLPAARADALRAIESAGRGERMEGAAQVLAIACIHSEAPQEVRAAAYDATVALIASDIVSPTTFRVLYEPWGDRQAPEAIPVVPPEEELLLHID